VTVRAVSARIVADWLSTEGLTTQGMARIRVLEEKDVNRLTAGVVVASVVEVYLGLLQNCMFFELLMVGIQGKATSIDAFVDIDQGRLTIVDNGLGMSPDTLELMRKDKIVNCTAEKSLFSHSGSCTILVFG